jgi:predicted pyridoxine 5'-phosphate oxidase superfamily flavin-nucleotide-binding protein
MTILPPRHGRPGSSGERALQEELGTTARADRFYSGQVLDHLNAAMREFVGRQKMFFLATASATTRCALARRGSSRSSTRAPWPGRSSRATG